MRMRLHLEEPWKVDKISSTNSDYIGQVLNYISSSFETNLNPVC